MNRLPRELVDAVLMQCVARGPKNDVLPLRLVCRLFDHVLKPFACRTLGLEFSRLSRKSGMPQPQIDALQTVGYHCKSLYIDLMVVRDEMEVSFLDAVFARVPSMAGFCQSLQKKYCLNEESFTEVDYLRTVEEMLFYCRDVEGLRLNLPFQLVGRHCNASTIILANTLKALAHRPEEDSKQLKTLVMENVTDVAIGHLWLNPSDVENILKVLEVLEHLVMTLRRHATEPRRQDLLGRALWSWVAHASELETLCLIGMDHEERPPKGLKQTKHWQMPFDEWQSRALPGPASVIFSTTLTCLELKRIEVDPDFFVRLAEHFGSTLQELYLNEVYLKADQGRNSANTNRVLWVGVPNQRPGVDDQWVAMALRCNTPHLRVCRAAFLAYDLYLREDIAGDTMFDFTDPSGLSRSISQRFVEVVMGISQPNTTRGDLVDYLPRDMKDDRFTQNLTGRTRAPRVTDYDANAYQTAVANSTSEWQRSIDGVFPNCNSNTLDELHYIAETACQGMNEIHRRRDEWVTGISEGEEFPTELFNRFTDENLNP
ncbi:hypothetical protein G7046_g9580 [Stylonectria norvegica]|nr:hypothetical protein G7046_g9580 [Stylonectria norvegica]